MKITSFRAFCATVLATVGLLAVGAGPAQAVTYTTTVDTGYRGLCTALGDESVCDVIKSHAVYASAIVERVSSTSVRVSGRLAPFAGSTALEGVLVISLKDCTANTTKRSSQPADITGMTSTLTRGQTFTGLISTHKYAAFVTSTGTLRTSTSLLYWSQWDIKNTAGISIPGATMTSACV